MKLSIIILIITILNTITPSIMVLTITILSITILSIMGQVFDNQQNFFLFYA